MNTGRWLAVAMVCGVSRVAWSCEMDALPGVHGDGANLVAAWEAAGPAAREVLLGEVKVRRPEARGALLERLRSGSAEMRLLACAVLESDPDPAVETALCAAAKDRDPRVSAQALLSLGKRGGTAAVAAIRARLAQAPEGGVLKASLAALGEAGDQSDREALTVFLDDADESVRVNAAAALARLGDFAGEALLRSATESTDPQARREATHALGWLESAESAAILESILADPQGRWRAEAKRALESRGLGGPAEATNAKHATAVHGRGVSDDPERCLTANAFAVLQSPGYTEERRAAVALGTVDEDNGKRPIDHFYNPVTGLNTMPTSGETALDRGGRLWDQAVRLGQSPLARETAAPYKLLGRSMHMLQDMTSPAHVHDDPHVPPIDPDDFEFWGEVYYPKPEDIVPGLTVYEPEGSLTLPTGEVVAAGSARGLVQGMALFTYELTSFTGDLVAESGVQPDSELARMFPDGRLYFQDGGILGANYWQIDNVGPYRLVGDSAWLPCAGDFTTAWDPELEAQRVSGRFYIENIGGEQGDLVPAVFERPLVHVADPVGMTLLQIQGAELYPECVRRCAAYLKAYEDATTSTGSGCAAAVQPDGGTKTRAAGDLGVVGAVCGILVAAGWVSKKSRNQRTRISRED